MEAECKADRRRRQDGSARHLGGLQPLDDHGQGVNQLVAATLGHEQAEENGRKVADVY